MSIEAKDGSALIDVFSVIFPLNVNGWNVLFSAGLKVQIAYFRD